MWNNIKCTSNYISISIYYYYGVTYGNGRFVCHIELDKKIYEMSVSEKQTVEIVKALYRGADVLILDEPTAVLTPQEIDRLFDVLRAMREDGKSVIIITHNQAIAPMADRIVRIKSGKIQSNQVNENIVPIERIEW